MDYICTDNITAEQYHTAYQAMDSVRKARCDRLRDNEAKRLCIAADMLARKMLAKEIKTTPESLEFYTDPNGKPFVKGYDINFSVSHSGNIAMCAVSHYPIGADIELVCDPPERVMKRVCPNGCGTRRFFEIWTMTESYGKLTGKGVANALSNLKLEFNGNQIKSNIEQCLFLTVPCPNGYIASLCIKKSP